MADATQNIRENGNAGQASSPPKVRGPSKKEQLNKLYALPAPLRTFPLPTLVPHNPLSLIHVLFVWLSQTVRRPSSNFEPQYYGWFSLDTRSVHVNDSRSIRGLWEQGFYGKGSLSRSEPNWLKTEESRRGKDTIVTSEESRRKFRAKRQQMKWERARKEREAIEQKLAEEAGAVATPSLAIHEAEVHESQLHGASLQTQRIEIRAPVGPQEILALPNSLFAIGKKLLPECDPGAQSSLSITNGYDADHTSQLPTHEIREPRTGPLQLLALPNSSDRIRHQDEKAPEIPRGLSQEPFRFDSNGHASTSGSKVNGFATTFKAGINGSASAVNGHLEPVGSHLRNGPLEDEVDGSNGIVEFETTPDVGDGHANSVLPEPKKKKSVRFSPTVEKNTFIQSEPPSPERSVTASEPVTSREASEISVSDLEHLQLTLEEAFFLSYALGSLTVLDPVTTSAIPNKDLFSLFRQASRYPPPPKAHLSPDDPFLVNYVVYHHFRSLGWVVRGGLKFSVDFMLYIRGPVFTHAEFAVLVLPSYSDPYWKSDVFLQRYVQGKEERKWSWLHCINRVITQVRKTLILVYVDIPKPLDAAEERQLGVDEILCRYKVREFAVKRWSANRMRD